jgi:hypothetical protein
MQVVPAALLDFSKRVMRAAFSTVLHKPIYTFRFDRFAGADRVGRLAATLLKVCLLFKSIFNLYSIYVQV